MGDSGLFTSCDFLMGQGQSIVIVVPSDLPKAETYTVSVSDREVRFKAGYNEIATVPMYDSEIYKRLSRHSQVGLVEYPKGSPWPDCITALAYVEVRKGVQQ